MTTPTIIRRPVAVGNFKKGRRLPPGIEVDTLVAHVTQGTAASARAWFNDSTADVSSNYLISIRGGIDQFVDEEDMAQAQGIVDHPTAAIVLERPGINPNEYCISIEHEGSGKEELTPEQRAASIWLISDITRRRPAIKRNRRHIIGHHEIRRSKNCPGAISVDALVKTVAEGWAPIVAKVVPAARPSAPEVVWSDYLHDWLVVTRVVNDTEWYFVPAKSLKSAPARAAAPLSQMPRAA